MKTLSHLILTLCVVLLSACATVQVPEHPVNVQRHQAELAQLTKWRIKGKLAFKSPEEKFSVNLNWEQKERDFALNMSSFVGISVAQMASNDGLVELEVDDQTYQDTDASMLIWRITGWNIPVNSLPRWIKGQTAQLNRGAFDENGLLSQLRPQCLGCDAWQIDYQRYKQVGDMWLPHQLSLTNLNQPDNEIKIRIYSWTQI